MYETSWNAIICSYINGFAKGGLMDKLRLAAKLPVLILTIMVTMVYVSQGVKLLESACSVC